eukprot:s984_g10.t2
MPEAEVRGTVAGAQLAEMETSTHKYVRPDKSSPFRSKVASAVPGIGVEAYLQRIATYFQCHDSCHVIALIFIDRLVKTRPDIISVNKLTIHRLLGAVTVVAAKIHDDHVFRNVQYAKVCGISLKELNKLEACVTSLLNWRLTVPVEEFQEYLDMLQIVS